MVIPSFGCHYWGTTNPYLFSGRVWYRSETKQMVLDVFFDERKFEEHPKPVIQRGPDTFFIDAFSRDGGPWEEVKTYPSWLNHEGYNV